MDNSSSKKGGTEQAEAESLSVSKGKRSRQFSPDTNDDVFQPSPFRIGRTEAQADERSRVLLDDSAGCGSYTFVEDITCTSPYTRWTGSPIPRNRKQKARLPGGNNVSVTDSSPPQPVSIEDKGDVFEDILHRAERGRKGRGISGHYCPEKRVVSPYGLVQQRSGGYTGRAVTEYMLPRGSVKVKTPATTTLYNEPEPPKRQ